MLGTKLCILVATYYLLVSASIASPSPLEPAHFTHVSVQDGLSQVTVSDIVEDNIGFMWFSTQNGINRFDGYNFVHYKKDKDLDGSGPIGDFIYKLAVEASSGDIWAASSKGLSRFEQKSNRFIHYPLMEQNGTQHHFAATVTYDRTGQLWVGTSLGLFKHHPATDSFVHIQFENNKIFRVQDIQQDINGVLWLATSQGLYGFTEGEPLHTVDNLKNVEVTDIEQIGQNQLWFSTNGKGIFVKNDTDAIIQPIKDAALALSGYSISSLKQTQNGDIWISTTDGLIITSLSTARTVSFKHHSYASSLLSANHMTRTYESRSGLIWQGTWTAGFSTFDPNGQQFKTLNAGESKATRGVASDAQGNIWFGTPEGLWRRNKKGQIAGPWTFEDQADQTKVLDENNIMSIAVANSTNKIWVGTRSGLAYLSANQKHLKYITSMRGSLIYALTTDNQGDVWAGDFNNGLFYIDGQTHSLKNHWDMSSITEILIDTNDLIWVGTMEGLLRVNKQTGEMLDLHSAERKALYRSPRVITWISKTQAPAQGYWIGVQGSGVMNLRYEQEPQQYAFHKIAADSHLSTLSIGGIEQDKNGNLWASTTEGIAKLDTDLQTPKYFSDRNGAQKNGYYINNSVTNIDGQIFFGGPAGITYFQPENITQSTLHPPIIFTNLSILGKPVDKSALEDKMPALELPIYLANQVTLEPKDNVFSIEFSALDFSAPKQNQYAFMLEGFDTTWNKATSKNRVATYTNLDPGTYKLLVKGTNKDGVWSDKVGQITINVTPYWWQTTWAKLLFLAATIILLIGFYRRRVFELKKQSHMLSMLVEERTAELKAMNKKLLTLSTIDDLTGLNNRRAFRDKAMQEASRFVRGGKPFCILLIDIDYFKQVNDLNGHACGDKVLLETAQLMNQHIRRQDLLARWGGEEFIMMMVETEITQGQHIAEKVRLAVEKNFVAFEGRDIRISVTIGVSQISPSEELDDCINRADNHLYTGKNNQRNQVVTDVSV